MELLHHAMWHDHATDFVRWLHFAMWHVALESWQWIHQVAAPCNVIRGSGNSSKCPPYGNSTSGFDFDHRSRHVILHQSAKFYPNRTTLGRKKGRFPGWRISAILDFRDPSSNNGFFENPNYITSYRSSIDTIPLNSLFFEKIAFFCILATDRQTNKQTNEQMDSTDAQSALAVASGGLIR